MHAADVATYGERKQMDGAGTVEDFEEVHY